MYISRPCALGRKQSNEGLGVCSLATSGEGPAVRLECASRRPAPSRSRGSHSSSCLMRCERRASAGFRELLLASEASAKNLKIDGKLFQEVSSWRSVPAKNTDSVTGASFRAEAQAAGPPPGAQSAPPPRPAVPAPAARGPSRPHLYLRVHAARARSRADSCRIRVSPGGARGGHAETSAASGLSPVVPPARGRGRDFPAGRPRRGQAPRASAPQGQWRRAAGRATPSPASKPPTPQALRARGDWFPCARNAASAPTQGTHVSLLSSRKTLIGFFLPLQEAAVRLASARSPDQIVWDA